jgi:hypothetical protein
MQIDEKEKHQALTEFQNLLNRIEDSEETKLRLTAIAKQYPEEDMLQAQCYLRYEQYPVYPAYRKAWDELNENIEGESTNGQKEVINTLWQIYLVYHLDPFIHSDLPRLIEANPEHFLIHENSPLFPALAKPYLYQEPEEPWLPKVIKWAIVLGATYTYYLMMLTNDIPFKA